MPGDFLSCPLKRASLQSMSFSRSTLTWTQLVRWMDVPPVLPRNSSDSVPMRAIYLWPSLCVGADGARSQDCCGLELT